MMKEVNMPKDYRFVILTSYLGSGSSAVRDLLKEFEGFHECRAEIRFLTDSYGLIRLEDALLNNWDWVASTGAIYDYISVCKKYCRKKNNFPFTCFGLNYKKNINPDFMKITYKFLNRISCFKYKEDFYDIKMKKGYFRYCFDRIRYGIEFYSKGKIRVANRNIEPLYFAKPTKEQFYEAVKDYLEELFEPHFAQGNTHLILDQALTATVANKVHDYFRNAKVIVTDRDPRDMYANELRLVNLNTDCYSEKYVKEFCIRQRAIREGIPNDDCDIMKVQFENLIVDYEENMKRIADFVGVPMEKHQNPFLYLDPKKSIKNVGYAKKSYPQYEKIYEQIEREIPEYIYTGKTELV